MLNSVSYLDGSKIMATDDEIGHVKEVFFDDRAWTIRYLVVDTGAWLPGREVLVSPYSVIQPLGSGKMIDVSLTRAQVEKSPVVDTHKPVSRQHENEYVRYYALPDYWEGTDLWGMTALPLLPPPLPVSVESSAEVDLRQANVPARDAHLRSSAEVAGYEIQAADAASVMSRISSSMTSRGASATSWSIPAIGGPAARRCCWLRTGSRASTGPTRRCTQR